ncbi:MAG: NYN domain-containing protein [Anaerolineaceae bacterium]|nr:NYN domain-containing protein [Anaerolineaceae bacterium]
MNNENNSHQEKRIAILIDGDNAQSSLMEQMVLEASRFGSATIRRVYGDWTTSNMKSWKEILNSYAFQPIQQFRYTVGKNATDSAMIIDAMDILHKQEVDGFCLVSSDSDYTRLATRIRESGKQVVGIGRRLTPKAFVSACDVFIYTENLEEREKQKKKASDKQQKAEKLTDLERELIDHINQAIEVVGTDDEGWCALSEVGTALRRIEPSFDPRTYGSGQLATLVRAKKAYFELKKVPGKSIILIRSKSED